MDRPRIVLSKKERKQIKRIKNPRILERILAISNIGKGKTYEEIASFLEVDVRSIVRWVSIYKTQGLKGLCEDGYSNNDHHSKLTKVQEKELKQHLENNFYRSAKAIAKYIEKTYGSKYSVSGVQRLIKRLGFSYKKPTPVPGKADKERQKAFIKEYEKIKDKLKPGDKIYFVDVSHFLHNAVPGAAWLPKGIRVYLPTNAGRKRINVMGAYNPDEMELISLQTQDKCNANRVKELMDLVKEANPQAKQIIFILDNAKYNHARTVKEYAKELGIVLVFLPPYSPNLNLIERFWRFMKEYIVKDHYYPIFKQFVAKIKEFLENLKLYKEELRSWMTEKFRPLGVSNMTF